MSKLDNFEAYLRNFFNPIKEDGKVGEPKVELQETENPKSEKKEVEVEKEVSTVSLSEFNEFKEQVLSMIKTLVEENKKSDKEVPTELSKDEPKEEVKVEEVELAEVEEIVHTPEVEKNRESMNLVGNSAIERIQNALNN